MSDLKPSEIVTELDKYIIGQDKAKRSVAVALRNRWRRQQVPEDLFPATIRRVVDLFLQPLIRPRPESVTGRGRPTTSAPVAQRRSSRYMARPSEQGAAYVANINSDIFHLHDCKWTKRIKPGNMIGFDGIEDALKKGFNPCRYCRPKQAGQVRPAYRPGVARKIAGYR